MFLASNLPCSFSLLLPSYLQQRSRTICPVIESFWIHLTHTFAACVVVLIDLLLDPQPQSSYRFETRQKVISAASSLRNVEGSKRAHKILNVLLEAEEKDALDGQSHFGSLEERATSRSHELVKLSQRIIELPESSDDFVPEGSGFPLPEETMQPTMNSGHEPPDAFAASVFASAWGEGNSEQQHAIPPPPTSHSSDPFLFSLGQLGKSILGSSPSRASGSSRYPNQWNQQMESSSSSHPQDRSVFSQFNSYPSTSPYQPPFVGPSFPQNQKQYQAQDSQPSGLANNHSQSSSLNSAHNHSQSNSINSNWFTVTENQRYNKW